VEIDDISHGQEIKGLWALQMEKMAVGIAKRHVMSLCFFS
jgi:hypothetical protein